MRQLILGSSSPRRQDMLRELSIPFTIRKPDVDEASIHLTNPQEKAEQLALLKAREIPITSDEEIVLTADTIVAYKDWIFEKPTDQADAYRMIASLSGKKHDVLTAVALRTAKEEKVFSVTTHVHFWELTEAEINAYIATTEPYDKAGGYGIQGRAGIFVKKIEGDYFNVVGLPIAHVVRELRLLGFNVDHYIFQDE